MTEHEKNKIENKIIIESTMLSKIKAKLKKINPIDIHSTTGKAMRQERDQIIGKLEILNWMLNGMKDD